jgi:peptide/nickel transport system substrate-binding protein
MRQSHTRRRSGHVIVAALVSVGLIAACSNKKDEGTEGATDETTEESVVDTGGETSTGETTPPTDSAAPDETDPPEEPAGDPVYGGTLIVSGEAEVTNPWTPAKMQCDSYCQQRARSIYDPLVALNANDELSGILLESWEPNEDFTVWTFTVRSGIKFHDGTDLDAAAVVKNLQLTGSGLLIAGAIKDYGKNADGTLAIEATGDMTFTITTGFGGDLSQPLSWPSLPLTLAGQLGMIASPTWLDAAVADPSLESKPVGTGPFVFESYAPRDKLVVTRNENYWMTDAAGNQLPYLDSIEYRVIEDSEIAADALRNGDIDIFSTSASLVIADFREDAEEFPMIEQDTLTETNYLLINLDQPGALQDQRVRCALSKAIDRVELIEATGGGILEPANGLFSPGQEGYLEDNGFDISQDIDAATAAIEEYEAETGEEVSIKYGTTTSQINAQIADLLEGYWTAIGADFEYIQVPQDSFITTALFGDPNFFIYGWRNHAGTTIDSQYFWWHSTSAAAAPGLALNFGRLRDDVVDQNLELARVSEDPADRQAAAEEVNRRMAEQCFQIPVSWTLWGTPHDPAIQGLGGFPLPDGETSKDGAGFSGQFYTHALWIDPEA